MTPTLLVLIISVLVLFLVVQSVVKSVRGKRRLEAVYQARPDLRPRR